MSLTRVSSPCALARPFHTPEATKQISNQSPFRFFFAAWRNLSNNLDRMTCKSETLKAESKQNALKLDLIWKYSLLARKKTGDLITYRFMIECVIEAYFSQIIVKTLNYLNNNSMRPVGQFSSLATWISKVVFFICFTDQSYFRLIDLVYCMLQMSVQ